MIASALLAPPLPMLVLQDQTLATAAEDGLRSAARMSCRPAAAGIPGSPGWQQLQVGRLCLQNLIAALIASRVPPRGCRHRMAPPSRDGSRPPGAVAPPRAPISTLHSRPHKVFHFGSSFRMLVMLVTLSSVVSEIRWLRTALAASIPWRMTRTWLCKRNQMRLAAPPPLLLPMLCASVWTQCCSLRRTIRCLNSSRTRRTHSSLVTTVQCCRHFRCTQQTVK